MGKVIKNSITGMRWKTRISLVLLITLATSVFMYEGWYKPKDTLAATLTYYMGIDTTTALTADGTCNVTGAAPYTSAGIGKTTTRATEAGAAYRYYPTTTAGATATVLNVYTPVYAANAVDISAISASAALRGLATTDTVKLDLYDYDPAGVANNGTLVASSAAKPITSATVDTQYTWTAANFTINGTGRVAQGHRLQFRFTWYAATAGTPRVMFGIAGATTSTNFTVTETAVAAGDTLTASANTALATSPLLANASGIVMQRFQVAANANSVELNSLTLDDLGTAAGTVANAAVWIDTVSSATLPGTAVLIGSTGTGWAGTSTVIPLNQGVTANRTVTLGTPKFIYIVYDLDNTQATKTIRSSVTALSVVTPDSVAAFAAMNSTAITLNAPPPDTLTVSANTPIALSAKDTTAGVVMQRMQLNSNANGDGQVILNSITMDDAGTATSFANINIYIDSTSSTTLPGTAVLIGQQALWDGVSAAIPLNLGTTANRTVTTANQYLYILFDMISGQATKTVQSHVTAVGVAAPDTGASGLNLSSNSFTLTVGPIFSVPSPPTGCSYCHGNPPVDGTGRNFPDGKTEGSHNTHTGSGAGQYGYVCTKCHINNTTSKHSNSAIDMANPINGNTGATYTRTADSVVANVFSPGTCSNTYCHSNGTGGTTQTGDTRAIVANTSPIWGGTATCYSCHGTSADVDGRPQYASGTPKKNSHTTASTHNAKACTVCHDSVTGTPGAYTPVAATHNNGSYNVVASLGYTYSLDGGTCSTVSCHGVAVWGVTTFDCVSCHTSPVTITNGPLANGTNQRRAVTTELTTSGSRNHKGTAISVAPTKWDCIVCHLEGNNDATGSLNATYHGNGVLDFRDPDGTGNQPIKKVSWGGLPYAANLSDAGGRYKDTLTNFTTARFSRDLSVVLESDPAWLKVASIQMNLCLHCHDNDGAKNSTAWTKNAAGTVVGTAYQPFGLAVGNSSAQYWVTTTLKSAAGNTTGNVMNVFSQLSSANASSHPVTGRGNNGYSRGTNMKAPWSGGTNTAKSSSTVYGYLISCFDCHGVKGSTGVQSATVVAHGNGSTINIVALRSPYPTAALGGVAISGGATNLCTLCHADTYVSGTTAHPDGMSPAGGNAGAFEAMSATTFGTCANCHVTYTDSVSARAVAVHGYNATEAGSATFPTTLSRPYAFWRGGPQVTYWGPGSCSVGGPGGSCTTQSYTTAGVY